LSFYWATSAATGSSSTVQLTVTLGSNQVYQSSLGVVTLGGWQNTTTPNFTLPTTSALLSFIVTSTSNTQQSIIVDGASFNLLSSLPTSSTGTTSSSSSSNGLSGGAIAGIVIGCIVGVLLIAIVLGLLLFKRGGGKNESHKKHMDQETEESSNAQTDTSAGEGVEIA